MFGAIKRLFEKRQVVHTNGDPGWLAAANVGAGVQVNEARALTIPAYLHGVRLYANVIASLDFDVLQRLERGKQCVPDHPVYRLIHDEPNEFQTSITFRQTMTGHQVGWGNAYAYIDRDDDFRPTALLPLLPDRTYPVRAAGALTYRTMVNGQTIDLEPYRVAGSRGCPCCCPLL